MHVEFRNFLTDLVLEWLRQSDFPAKDVANFQVLTPPENAEAFVGTNIAFSLSRKIAVEPVALSIQLAEFANKIEAPPFVLTAAASGYLNASPRNNAIEAFIEKFSAQIMNADFLKFSEKHLIDQIYQSQNPDIKKLINNRADLNKEDRQMALALLGDAELSVDPYLQGLKGKENTSWLLERFSRDWRMLGSKVKPSGLSKIAPKILSGLNSNTLILGQGGDFSCLAGVLKHQLLVILSIRSFESLEKS